LAVNHQRRGFEGVIFCLFPSSFGVRAVITGDDETPAFSLI